MALYGGHSVTEISGATPAAINLSQTSAALSDVIRSARENSRKCVCFVTGVPVAGKTLVGLNIATQHIDKDSDLTASSSPATGHSWRSFAKPWRATASAGAALGRKMKKERRRAR